MTVVPDELARWQLTLSEDGRELLYTFDTHDEHKGISSLLRSMGELGINYSDLNTDQSSLEEIFVELVRERT